MSRSSEDAPSSTPRTGSERPAPMDWAAQDWDDLMPRLLLLALARLARGRGLGAGAAAAAEALVDDAIGKAMAGLRVWDSANGSLFQHLAGVLVSDIAHARSSTGRPLRPDRGPGNGSTTRPTDSADHAPDQAPAAVWLAEQRRLLDHLRRIDPLIGRAAELMLVHDLCETRELGAALGLAPSEVAGLRGRIKSAVGAWLAEDRP